LKKFAAFLFVIAVLSAFATVAFADTSAEATFDYNWSSSGNDFRGDPYYYYEHNFYHMNANNTQVAEHYTGTFSPVTDLSTRTLSQAFTSSSTTYGDSASLSGKGQLIANSFSQRRTEDRSENAHSLNSLNFLSSLSSIPDATNASPNIVNLSGTYTSKFSHTETLPTTMWAGNTGLSIRHDIKLWGDYYDADGDGTDDTIHMWNGVIWGYYDHGVHTLIDPNADLSKSYTISESLDINPYSIGFSSFLDDDGNGNAWDGSFQVNQVGFFTNVIFASSVIENGPATVTPEPVSSTLFLIGGGLMALRRLKRKKS
jgi:hypothetical protein